MGTKDRKNRRIYKRILQKMATDETKSFIAITHNKMKSWKFIAIASWVIFALSLILMVLFCTIK